MIIFMKIYVAMTYNKNICKIYFQKKIKYNNLNQFNLILIDYNKF